MGAKGFEHMGRTMRGPDSDRLDELRASETGRIRRTADDGITVEEYDPDRAPSAPKPYRQ